MKKIQIPDSWWTAPAQSDTGQLIMVTGLSGLETIKQTGVFNYCIVIEWRYDPLPDGMPRDNDAHLMEQVTNAIQAEFISDPVAILVGMDTGNGRREYTIYTRSLHIFQRKINEILTPFEQLPLAFSAFEDPDWERYDDIMQSEIQL